MRENAARGVIMAPMAMLPAGAVSASGRLVTGGFQFTCLFGLHRTGYVNERLKRQQGFYEMIIRSEFHCCRASHYL